LSQIIPNTHFHLPGGEFFTDYQEQKAMLEILVKTDVELAWPTASAQSYLLEKWDWNQV
jgi:hypothetical protein